VRGEVAKRRVVAKVEFKTEFRLIWKVEMEGSSWRLQIRARKFPAAVVAGESVWPTSASERVASKPG
jgi:hypothetical protein